MGMKNNVFVIVGIFLIMFVLLCPLPPVLGVQGLLWRLVIGLLGSCAIIKVKKKGQ